jgi:hypothetical protein
MTERQGVNICCPCNQLQIAFQIAMPKLMFDQFFVGYAKFLKPQFVLFASPLALRDNTNLGLYNSSYPTRSHSIMIKYNSLEIINVSF